MTGAATPEDHLGLAAVRYAKFGWPVFPLQGGGKLPKIPKSDGGRGFHDATTDIRIIGHWWAEWPDANIGIRTGDASGVFVLDVDINAGGFESIDMLEATRGALPTTLKAQTATGGVHYFFRQPESGLRNSASKIAPGCDIRAEGGYVAGVPSRRDGSRYEWLHKGTVADAPEWLLALAAKPAPPPPPTTLTVRVDRKDGGSRYGLAALSRAEGDVRSAPAGTRNHTLNACAYSIGRLVAGGELDGETAAQALVAAATEAGLSMFEAINTVRSGVTSGMENPKSAPPPPDLATLMSRAVGA